MTPKELDYVLNGAKVFIYERPDGTRYASVHDYSRFRAKEVALIRVPLTPTSSVESVLNTPEVIEALGPNARQPGDLRIGDHRANCSPLTPRQPAQADADLAELDASSRPASRKP